MSMRRTVTTILFTFALTGIMAGCGGGGGSSNDIANTERGEMVVGRIYALNPGDTIVRRSDDAEVVLRTDLASGKTTATLQKGRAAIE